MGLLDEKKQNKRSALMKTAFELFAEKGMEHTSVSEICFKAGMAKGTFYLYFKDKDDLRRSLTVYHTNVLFTGAEQAMAKERGLSAIDEKLIFIADYIIDVFVKDPMLMKFISRNLSWGSFKSTIESETGIALKSGGSLLGEMTAGYIERPEIVLFLITEMVSGSSCSPITECSPAAIEEVKPYIFRAIKAIVAEFKTGQERE